MAFFQPLSAKDTSAVLQEAKKILKNGSSRDIPGGFLRAAIAGALREKGYWRSGLDSNRETAIARAVGRAVGLINPSARDVEKWAKDKTVEHLAAALDETSKRIAA